MAYIKKMPYKDVHQPFKQTALTLTDADSYMKLAELLFEELTKCIKKNTIISNSDAGIPTVEI